MGNNKLTSKQTCGVVILAGLIFNLIAFFGADISIAKENHIYMYLFIDLLFIAGFGLAGYALYKDQGDDHDYGKKTVQQDKEAVVAVRNRSVGIKSSSLCSQGQKVLQVIHTKSEDEPEHTAFQRQKCDSSCILTP